MTVVPDDWRARLQEAVAKHPRKITGLAREIGLSRSALSTVLSGKYPAKSLTGPLQKVALWLGGGNVTCPFLKKIITEGSCWRYRTRPQPSGDARELRHYVACEDCPIGDAVVAKFGKSRKERGDEV